MKAKRVLALLLALALCASLFAACGGDGGSSSSAGGTSSASSEAGGESSEAGTESGEDASAPEGGDAAGGGYSFPLAEPVTLTAWRTAATTDPKLGIVTYNDIESVMEWEKRTNVHIDWQIPTSGQETENFNLMITSGDYPDLIFDANARYVGGLGKAIQDGVVRPLDDMIETLGKDYLALISQDEMVLKDCKTDDGQFGAVFAINCPDQGPWYGMAMRQDWLTELKLDTPVTYDDWHDVLTAFKEKKGAKAPLWLTYTAGDWFGVFSAGYGVGNLGGNTFFRVDNQVKYSPAEEGYKKYLTTLHQWYSEGLLDADYYTRTTSTTVPETLANTGDSGAWPDIYTLLSIHTTASEDPNIDVVAVPAPVEKEGDQLHLRQYNWTRGTDCCAISTSCENPELAMAWLNLGSQQDFAYLAYYGIEGETHTIEDGKPVFTDKVLNNPEGLVPNDAMIKYCWRSPGMYIWDRELQTADEKSLEAINDIWVSNADGDYMMPNVTLTADEGTRYATLLGDIKTYAEEMTTKFILGDEPLENFDSYVEAMKGMGLEEMISLQQAALDRFNAR